MQPSQAYLRLEPIFLESVFFLKHGLQRRRGLGQIRRGQRSQGRRALRGLCRNLSFGLRRLTKTLWNAGLESFPSCIKSFAFPEQCKAPTQLTLTLTLRCMLPYFPDQLRNLLPAPIATSGIEKVEIMPSFLGVFILIFFLARYHKWLENCNTLSMSPLGARNQNFNRNGLKMRSV